MLAAAALSPPDATGQQRWLAVGGFLVGAQAPHKVSALAFAPNGQWLLTDNFSPPRPRPLALFAYYTGRVQQTFTGHANLVIATGNSCFLP